MEQSVCLLSTRPTENMTSKSSFRKKSRRHSRQLQALRDFTAADTCYSDGANPLSFQIGETFTFLSRRDNYWFNVERTVWKNNPLLKNKEYLATERGIVPVDYVIEMASTPNGGLNLPNSGYSDLSKDDEGHDDIIKLRTERDGLFEELEQYKRKLDEAYKENATLHERAGQEYRHNVQLVHQLLEQYYAVSEMLVTAKEELSVAQQSMIEEQEKSKKYQNQLEDIKTQIHKSSNKAAIKVLDKILQKEAKPQSNYNGLIQKKRTLSSPEELMLSCALCHEKMRVEELATHSKVCSSKETVKQPQTPTSQGVDMLRVTVTCSETDEKNATFKVVTKTTQENFKFSDYEVHRSDGDFDWLQTALEEACPDRIVPPLVSHSSLHGKMREVQRFLSRICAHKVLRKHHLLNLFLTGKGQDIQKAREDLERKRSRTNSSEWQPAKRESCDQNAPVIKCQKYLEQFSANLEGLITHLRDSLNKNSTGTMSCVYEVLFNKQADGPGYWFKSLADFEPTETYLKAASAALSKICIELENNQETAEEKLIVNDLESVYHYVRSAQGLLARVQSAVNTFLLWDEQVRDYEQMKEPNSDENKLDIQNQTQKWAEANSNCADAKANLEFLCKDLAHELAHFDWRKEVELRDILIEYSALRSEHYEKVQSKWFGVKFMVEAPISADVRAIKCVEDVK